MRAAMTGRSAQEAAGSNASTRALRRARNGDLELGGVWRARALAWGWQRVHSTAQPGAAPLGGAAAAEAMGGWDMAWHGLCHFCAGVAWSGRAVNALRSWGAGRRDESKVAGQVAVSLFGTPCV